MKIKDGYLLRDVAGSTVVVPLDDSLTFHGMIKLNGSGKFLWEQLAEEKTREELLQALCKAYEIDEATAAQDLDAFLSHLREMGVLAD